MRGVPKCPPLFFQMSKSIKFPYVQVNKKVRHFFPYVRHIFPYVRHIFPYVGHMGIWRNMKKYWKHISRTYGKRWRTCGNRALFGDMGKYGGHMNATPKWDINVEISHCGTAGGVCGKKLSHSKTTILKWTVVKQQQFSNIHHPSFLGLWVPIC
jgi:hypothetical protein